MDLFCGCGCQYQCPSATHPHLFSAPCCQKVRGNDKPGHSVRTAQHIAMSKDKTSFSIDSILARDKTEAHPSGYLPHRWKGYSSVGSQSPFCKPECSEKPTKLYMSGEFSRRSFINEPTMVRLGRCNSKYQSIVDCEECSRAHELEVFTSGSPTILDHDKLSLHDGTTPSSLVMELKRCKRKRTIFTAEQLDRLEHEFQHQQYIVGQERKYLARELGLNEIQVKVWFQNRRIKWRKQRIGRNLESN